MVIDGLNKPQAPSDKQLQAWEQMKRQAAASAKQREAMRQVVSRPMQGS